jgi:hypothetical protein
MLALSKDRGCNPRYLFIGQRRASASVNPSGAVSAFAAQKPARARARVVADIAQPHTELSYPPLSWQNLYAYQTI